jgi:cell shape-determining protein MreC
MTIVTIKPRRTIYTTQYNVKHWSGELTNSIRIESDTPPVNYAVGDRLTICGLEGFPESRLTVGRVRAVKRTLSGGAAEVRYDITVDADELQDSEL